MWRLIKFRPRPRPASRRRLALRLLAVTVAAVQSLAPGARALDHYGAQPVFRPPVEAPVADPYRQPENPYGAGNRGVEYNTRHGEVVRAAASGTVTFAGAVAGSLHVTLDHGGGLRSSYSHLARIAVRAGARVAQGQVVGIAGSRLHFGVRRDGAYVDPSAFIGVRRVRVRLVPLGWWRPRRGTRRGRYTAALALEGPTAPRGAAESFRNPCHHPVV